MRVALPLVAVVIVALLGGVAWVVLYGGGKPPEDAARATVEEAQPVARQQPAPEAPEEASETEVEVAAPAEELPVHAFRIEPNFDSEIGFVGYGRVAGAKEGGFANFNGEVTLRGDDLENVEVDLVVDMHSLYSVDRNLTDTIKGDRFFDVDEHPEARFSSTSVRKTDDGYLITGNFEMVGQTMSISFPVVIERGEDSIRAATTGSGFTIDRNNWGLDWKGMGDNIIQDEVLISFDILAEAA